MNIPENSKEYFESRICKESTEGCWLWTGTKTKAGYGQMVVDYKRTYAHRYSYEFYKGKIPEGMHVLHSCDVPLCVNPEHLSLGTPLDNMRDMISKGREYHPKGEKHCRSKLNKEWVKQIRLLHSSGKFPQKLLAMFYGVSQQLISDIVNNKSWKQV